MTFMNKDQNQLLDSSYIGAKVHDMHWMGTTSSSTGQHHSRK